MYENYKWKHSWKYEHSWSALRLTKMYNIFKNVSTFRVVFSISIFQQNEQMFIKHLPKKTVWNIVRLLYFWDVFEMYLKKFMFFQENGSKLSWIYISIFKSQEPEEWRQKINLSGIFSSVYRFQSKVNGLIWFISAL